MQGAMQRRPLRGGLFRFNSFGRPSLFGRSRLDFRRAGRLLPLLMRPSLRLLDAAPDLPVFHRPAQIPDQTSMPMRPPRRPTPAPPRSAASIKPWR
jgi:hypothetical protein